MEVKYNDNSAFSSVPGDPAQGKPRRRVGSRFGRLSEADGGRNDLPFGGNWLIYKERDIHVHTCMSLFCYLMEVPFGMNQKISGRVCPNHPSYGVFLHGEIENCNLMIRLFTKIPVKVSVGGVQSTIFIV